MPGHRPGSRGGRSPGAVVFAEQVLPMPQRKAFPLRIDAELYAALRNWADDEFRSMNGQIEYLLRDALRQAGRLKPEHRPPRNSQSARRQGMKEKLRDKTRDKLVHSLNALGVGATMAERGRPEERIRKSWGKRSLGVIDIPQGPIRYINIVRQDGSQYSPPQWWLVLCIPDERPFSKRRRGQDQDRPQEVVSSIREGG